MCRQRRTLGGRITVDAEATASPDGLAGLRLEALKASKGTQSETGWHVSEVQRFATAGEIEPPAPSQKELGTVGILIVRHKSGEQHRTAVTAKTLEAARRLRERGGLSIAWYTER